jgi:transcriptional regulator NrdR family protein
MTTVIKRGGRRQAFVPSKIRKALKGAAREAGFSAAKQRELVEEVGEAVINFFKKKKLVKSIDIRKSILRRLSTRAKSAASAWKKFEKRKK